MGAWIETSLGRYFMVDDYMSHPMWVRGLKLVFGKDESAGPPSHPMWVRGLKPMGILQATRADLSRTLCGCVD